jgi:hypothetical protein
MNKVQLSVHYVIYRSISVTELNKKTIPKWKGRNTNTGAITNSLKTFMNYRLQQFIDSSPNAINIPSWTSVPMTVVARSKARTVFACSNTWIVSSNPTQGIDVCLLLFCVLSRVGSSLVTGLILHPRSPTDCLRIKKLKWNRAFHGCSMLQNGSNKRKREKVNFGGGS